MSDESMVRMFGGPAASADACLMAIFPRSATVPSRDKKARHGFCTALAKATLLFHGKRMVKMEAVELTCFAFLTGLTLCGLAGSTMELAAGRRLSFADPFVSSSHVSRSLAAAAAAGPFMLGNDALDARRRGEVSALVLVSCALTSAGWLLATGVVAIDLACRAAVLLS